MREIEPVCYKDADFLFELGRLLNQLRRYDEAIDPLEGALLHRPEHLAAQLEYAIALEGVGDHDAAQDLLRQIAGNPGLDAEARSVIVGLTQGSPAPPRKNLYFSLATGYDNNLLGSTSSTQFDLTTPGGPITVQLAEDQLPRAGSFNRTELIYSGQFQNSEVTNIRYSLGATLRNSPSFPVADQNQWSGLIERSSITQSGVYTLLQYQTLVQAGTTAVQQAEASVGYDLLPASVQDCMQRVGLDWRKLKYPNNPDLDGIYTGLGLNTVCPVSGWSFQARLGQDRPVQDIRPGGRQNQANVRLSKQTALGPGNLVFDLQASRQEDESGYSLLLADNAVRTINRQSIRAEYRWQMAGWSPYFSLEWLDQQSTHAPFVLKNQIVSVGFRSNL